jgi:Family of unknown function (DUF5990)
MGSSGVDVTPVMPTRRARNSRVVDCGPGGHGLDVTVGVSGVDAKCTFAGGASAVEIQRETRHGFEAPAADDVRSASGESGSACCSGAMENPIEESGRVARHTGAMQIRIEGRDLPGRECRPSPDAPGGYHNVHLGLQRRNQRDALLGLLPGDAASATWTLDCVAVPTPTGVDLKGPYIQGPPGGRFIYLSWGTVDDDDTFTLFRRAKLLLDAIPPAALDNAIREGLLVGRLSLTDGKGHPVCAAVRPPRIEWSASGTRCR